MSTRPSGIHIWLAWIAAWGLFCAYSARSASRDPWIEVRSPNFTVISNAGEKEARRTADQFEQFREVFQQSFPKLRVDMGRPLIILAVRNENSLKALLPAYWERKGRAHPAGIYVTGEERHFVAVRTNIEGENPYEVVYHEYTHAIMGLNFRGLPVWLGEGLAEYFGNSMIRDKEVDIGKISKYHLRVLQQSRLIPIDALLLADSDSPYYNEENRVSVFYAESWAIVHYLLLDPEARKQQLMQKFLSAWDKTGNQTEAAQQAFGDLKTFSQTIETYLRKGDFYFGKAKTSIHADPQSYNSRELAPAEIAAARALFYIHTRRPNEGEVAIAEALQADSKLSVAYEAKGVLAYSQNEYGKAEAAFSQAIELPEPTFSAYYFEAMSRLHQGVGPGHAQEIHYLEKAIAMNPQFAPAYASLASLYSMDKETQANAIQLARKAVDLDLGDLQYAINLAHVLLNAGSVGDAKILATRIQHSARSPIDKMNAEQLLQAIDSYEQQTKEVIVYAERVRSDPEQRATRTITKGSSPVPAAPESTPAEVESEKSPLASGKKQTTRTEYMMEGIIAAAECNPDSRGRVTLRVNHTGIKFIYSSLAKLTVVEGLKEDSGNAPACPDWKGRRAKFFFYQVKDKPYAGELQTIQFF
jgi:tetratricopeptide (TPR) repeat protein